MSILFYKALKKVIAEHDIVVARLAQAAGIDRTTLQHIIGGRRLPNKEQMNKLLQAIPVQTHEKATLLQAYEFTTDGPDKFKQREKVKAIIEKIAYVSMWNPTDALDESTDAMPVQSTTPADYRNSCASERLNGMFEINSALINIIGAEKDSVSFYMPSNFSFFYDTLLAKHVTSQTLAVACFFPMSNDADNIISDLEYCESFIPFFASPNYRFQAYYVRGQKALPDASIVPFPYFVLTSRHVLLVSADMNNAILTNQEAFVRIYRKKCQSFLNISSPLYTTPTIEGLMALFPQHPTKDLFATVENQPCIQYHLNEQIIKKYVAPTTKEDTALVQKYVKYVNEMKKESNSFFVFGQEGLDYFVETGTVIVWPPSLGLPLNVQDRKKILQNMLHDIKNDKFKCRLVNASKFTIPSITVLMALRRKTFFVQCLDYDGDNVKNICLTDKNVVEAFTDFFENLQNTTLVLSKEETIKVFEAALEKLGAKN